MRFEVPQFIEIEDKIIGPFTWKQFIYLGGGVGLAAVLFFTLPMFFFLLIGVPIGALSAALAFYPINNRPFSIFLESMWRYYKTNRFYYWKKKEGITYRGKTSVQGFGENGPYEGQKDLQSLSRKLELNSIQKTEQYG